MNIFFDFDGTLIDARQRIYGLFKTLVQECDLSFEDYWEIKRRQLDHRHILKTNFQYSEKEISAFVKKWMDEIEKESWLRLDKPFQEAGAYLSELSQMANLYIVTARQKPEMAIKQIERLQWGHHFKDVLVTKQENEKEDLIRLAVKVGKEDFIAGDTGKDIQAGKALGIKTIGVLSGFRNKEQLAKYNPDFIVDRIMDFRFEKYISRNHSNTLLNETGHKTSS
jgi:phosphoglycolate phosphatase